MTRKLNNISLKESMLNVQIRPALLCEMDAMELIKASFLSRITRKCKIRNEIMSGNSCKPGIQRSGHIRRLNYVDRAIEMMVVRKKKDKKGMHELFKGRNGC